MTISLTTSAGKLQDDVEHLFASNTTRVDTIKDRVHQSTQAKWLQHHRTGRHVFVMKVAERSRALDWFWELWRELGGELPMRVDVTVPDLSTTVRLLLPTDDNAVGSRRVCRELSPKNTLKTCWDMMEKAIDLKDLLSQRRDKGDDLDLELAWKSVDGTLDWVAYRTTVTGHARDWALLAGVATSMVSGSV